jgi:hypothetical protein
MLFYAWYQICRIGDYLKQKNERHEQKNNNPGFTDRGNSINRICDLPIHRSEDHFDG